MCGNWFSKIQDSKFAQFIHPSRFMEIDWMPKMFKVKTEKKLKTVRDEDGEIVRVNEKNMDSYSPYFLEMLPKARVFNNGEQNNINNPILITRIKATYDPYNEMTPQQKSFSQVDIKKNKGFENQEDITEGSKLVKDQDNEMIEKNKEINENEKNIEENLEGKKKPVDIFKTMLLKNDSKNKPETEKSEENEEKIALNTEKSKWNIENIIKKSFLGGKSLVYETFAGKTHHAKQFSVFTENVWKEIYDKLPEGKFIDGEFPPSFVSIIGYGMNRKNKPVDQIAKIMYSYRRTYKFLPGEELMSELAVIVDGISTTDIYQGALGDCYFLSAISAVAEYPERIGRLLVEVKSNDKKVFGIGLCICGTWRLVILDDFFPIKNGKIAFCHSEDAEIWAMLLEKAYAKVYKGYWNIGTGGFAEDALKDITGAPTEFFMINENPRSNELKKLWERLYKADQEKNIMVLGSRGQGEKENDSGIVSGHA